jgi:hypothetical protein
VIVKPLALTADKVERSRVSRWSNHDGRSGVVVIREGDGDRGTARRRHASRVVAVRSSCDLVTLVRDAPLAAATDLRVEEHVQVGGDGRNGSLGNVDQQSCVGSRSLRQGADRERGGSFGRPACTSQVDQRAARDRRDLPRSRSTG